MGWVGSGQPNTITFPERRFRAHPVIIPAVPLGSTSKWIPWDRLWCQIIHGSGDGGGWVFNINSRLWRPTHPAIGPLPAPHVCVCVLTFFPVQVIHKVVLDSNPPWVSSPPRQTRLADLSPSTPRWQHFVGSWRFRNVFQKWPQNVPKPAQIRVPEHPYPSR